ncbi:histidinol-phosphate phosphatase family protein [Paenibacillus wynnii]|nr:histidinol-phosphate phosphatase family protein [Paenibacillus wynnii]
MITNQGGIALNMYTVQHMTAFNAELRRKINADKGRIDAFYYCPHFEKKNLPEDTKMCSCSKPLPGLLFEAAEDFQINLAESYMIGDRFTDIEAGIRAGCKTILVKSGASIVRSDETTVEPDYITENLLEAALIIKGEFV